MPGNCFTVGRVRVKVIFFAAFIMLKKFLEIKSGLDFDLKNEVFFVTICLFDKIKKVTTQPQIYADYR